MIHPRWPLRRAGQGLLAGFWLLGGVGLVGADSLEGMIQLFDGSSLSGSLVTMNAEGGVTWRHPYAAEPIRFSTRNLAWIRFDGPGRTTRQASAAHQILFQNGDEIYGRLLSLSADAAAIETRTGEVLKTPRRMLKSIVSLPAGFEVLYEGPASMDGWTAAPRPVRTLQPNALNDPNPVLHWEYRNGGFHNDGPGILGRAFPFKETLSLKFDIAWTGLYGINLCLLSAAPDQDDYRTCTCRVYLLPGLATVQTTGKNGRISQLGRASIPYTNTVTRIQYEIKINPTLRKLALHADGELIQEWHDADNEWDLKGDAIVFSSIRSEVGVELSNIRVTTWEGDFDLPPEQPDSRDQDYLFLVNRDKVFGRVNSMENDWIGIDSEVPGLIVPMNRIRQLQFQLVDDPEVASHSGELRAFLKGGGKFSFFPEVWTEERVTGTSRRFGRMEFRPDSFRQIQFNPDRREPITRPVSTEFDQLWEIHE